MARRTTCQTQARRSSPKVEIDVLDLTRQGSTKYWVIGVVVLIAIVVVVIALYGGSGGSGGGGGGGGGGY